MSNNDDLTNRPTQPTGTIRDTATQINRHLDSLIAAYNNQLQEIKYYADLPASDRSTLAERMFKAIQTSLDTENETDFLHFIQNTVDQRLKQGLTPDIIQQALVILEQTLMPVVDTLEAAMFLWRLLSQSQQFVSNRAIELLRQSEENLYSVFNNMQDAFYRTDQSGRLIWVSPSVTKLLGYTSPEEILGLNIAEEFYAFPQARQAIIQALRTHGQVTDYEVVLRRRDGSHVTVSTNSALYYDKSGQVAGVEGIFRDITKRIQVEQALRESEERQRQILDTSPVAMLVSRLNSEIIYINQEMGRLFRTTPQAVSGQSTQLFYVNPEDRLPVLAALRQNGYARNFETHFKTADGEPFWALLSMQTFKFGNEENVILATVVDITDRKRAELALQQAHDELEQQVTERTRELTETNLTLRQNEKRYRALYSQTPALLHSIDTEGRMIEVSDHWLKVMGYDRNEVIGRPNTDFHTPASKLAVQQAMSEFFQTGYIQNVPYQLVKKNGEVMDILLSAVLEYDDRGKPVRSLTISIDVTDRKQAEEALRTSEARNRILLQAIPDLIIRYRADGTYLDVKPSKDFPSFSAPDTLIGQNLFAIAPPEIAQQQMHYNQLALQTRQAKTYEHSYTRQGQTRFEEIWVIPDEVADEVFVVIRDITERRQTELELAQERDLLQAFMDNVPDWVFFKDAQSRIIRNNKTHAQVLGLTNPADAIGKTDFDFFPREDAQRFYEEEQTFLKIGEPILGRLGATPAPDGTTLWRSETKVPIRDPKGQVVGLIGISRDVTELKQAEEIESKRAAELETVAQVSQAAATILETDKLLQEVADLTKRSFGLYHAHIYLLNEAGDSLTLAAGAGEVGRKMVAQGWSIPLERERSLVAQAARTRQGVIANNVRREPDFLPNPLLPDTRAEMAVPLLMGEQVLGVLDVQADTVDHFTTEDVRIQTILAGQIAVAVENARLFEESHRRARREQILREITARVRGSVDPDTIVRVAIRELGAALDRPTFVRLGSTEQLQNPQAAGEEPLTARPNSQDVMTQEGDK